MVAALDSATVTRAVSLLSSPPATDKYLAIKRFLTGAYELSECERTSALVNLHGLGESTPSELMDSMLSLIGGHTPCFFSFICSCSSYQTMFVPSYLCMALRTTEHCLKKRIGSTNINGSSIATYGARNASQCFGGRMYGARLM